MFSSHFCWGAVGFTTYLSVDPVLGGFGMAPLLLVGGFNKSNRKAMNRNLSLLESTDSTVSIFGRCISKRAPFQNEIVHVDSLTTQDSV